MFVSKKSFLLSMVVFTGLTACHEVPEAEKKQQASSVQTSVVGFNTEIREVKLNLPSCTGDSCPEFKIQHLESNQPFINRVIDQKILQALNGNSKALDTQSVDQNTFLTEVQKAVDALLKENKADSAEGDPTAISINLHPEVLKTQNHLTTILFSNETYLGGAHGSASQEYLHFDLASKKQVQLDDILLPEKEKVLKDLVYEKFKQWVIQENLANSIKEYEQTWPFTLSHNFYFDKDGITFEYEQYEIAAYALGMPSFTVSYKDLQNVVKPEFLPKAKIQPASASQSSGY